MLTPAVAYMVVVTTVMSLLLTVAFPHNRLLKVVAGLGALITLYALFQFDWHPWALAMLAISPIPVLVQRNPRLEFLLFTIFMAMGGTFFLFTNEAGGPVVNYALIGTVSIICGQVLWSIFYSGRRGKRQPPVDYRQSAVGLVGKVVTEIELRGTGSVEVEGETWTARSDQPIAAGRSVRVMRQDGAVLTVKEVKKFIPDQQ